MRFILIVLLSGNLFAGGCQSQEVMWWGAKKSSSATPIYHPDTVVMPPPGITEPGAVRSGDLRPGDVPPPPSMAFVDNAPPMAQSHERQVIYTAQLTLTVPNLKQAYEQIIGIVQNHKGYVQRDTMERVTFRVPPAAFRPALRELESLGQVSERQIESQDVTEAYFDFKLRIDVAEGSRKRLMDLLDKTAKLEDILRAEQDIRRLTQEIEQMKGQLRLMQQQIEFATISVRLVQPPEQVVKRRPLDETRFPRLREVGIEQVLAPVPRDAELDGGEHVAILVRGPRFRLGFGGDGRVSENFSILLDDGNRLVAATPEDYRLRAQVMNDRHENPLEFWRDALKEELTRNRGYLVESADVFVLNATGMKACRLRCRTTFSGEGWRYDAWIIQRPGKLKELLVIEFAESEKAGDGRFQKIDAAVKSLHWRGKWLGG